MKVGECFRVEHKGKDKSYLGDMFLCTGHEQGIVIGVILRKHNYGNQIFNIKEWNIYPVQTQNASLMLTNFIDQNHPVFWNATTTKNYNVVVVVSEL